MTWIIFTCFAIVMQTIRTSLQKHIAQDLGNISATMARYFFGFPIALVYFIILFLWSNIRFNQINFDYEFFFFSSIASVTQIIATIIMLQIFQKSNYAVGNFFAKTEAIIITMLGVLLFNQTLSMSIWFCVLLSFIGIILMSNIKMSEIKAKLKFCFLGVLSGLLFAICALSLRHASLSLEIDGYLSAAITLCFMTFIQTLLCIVIKIYFKLPLVKDLFIKPKQSASIGFTSALGSIGWFTAMTLQLPSLVKIVAQSEIILTLFVTKKIFKEKISKKELYGIFLTCLSVILILSLQIVN